jgi:DNA-binding FrmR family transcriptional regulator
MENSEILFQLRRLQRYIAQVRETQTDCDEEHECHWVDKLIHAEDIAVNVIREIETQEGEHLVAATQPRSPRCTL